MLEIKIGKKEHEETEGSTKYAVKANWVVAIASRRCLIVMVDMGLVYCMYTSEHQGRGPGGEVQLRSLKDCTQSVQIMKQFGKKLSWNCYFGTVL